MSASREWDREFREAASNFDRVRLGGLATDFAAYLYAAKELPLKLVELALQVLRQNLRYEELEVVADAALAHDVEMPTVRKHYAQALVDGGNPAVALRIYRQLASELPATDRQYSEAWGGVGRCYKELFLACAEPTRRAQYIRHSLDAYLRIYLDDKERNIWHGINAVALACRAERDQIPLDPQMPEASIMATDILESIDAEPLPDAWAEVTACEALVALGRGREAVVRAEAFVNLNSDGFYIASFYRQLRTVWQLNTASPPGDDLLPLLRSAVLKNEDGGRVTVDAADVQAARVDALGDGLEKVLGVDRFQSLKWYRTGLVRCRAVARVQTVTDDAVGTGFLVDGPSLHPGLPALVLLTNGHVVPEGVPANDAVVVFHGLDDEPGAPPHRFRVRRLLWHEPSTSPGLDTSILELTGYPSDVTPVPLAPGLPSKPLVSRRAYVIGHPRGLEQPHFSLQDNILLDYDERVLHYRSPTEGGSSGSPVFNNTWGLIGLHHAGGFEMPRLNALGGTYAANEGVTVDAIRTALAARPPS